MRKTIAMTLLPIFYLTAAVHSADEAATQNEPSRHDRIYHFQHRVLPKWAHGTKGEFYRDLLNENYDRLSAAASDIVGKDFSNEIKVQRVANPDGILLLFSTPVKPLECYFVFITKGKAGYRFFTYEKAEDLFGSGDKGVIGEWVDDGRHINLGPRSFEDEEQFIGEIVALH